MATDYTALVTSEHQDKPKFIEMIAGTTAALNQLQSLTQAMVDLYDVDVAVGSQLDAIGKWAGISRDILITLPNVYFTFDDTDTTGWDFGIWQGGEDTGITSLPDQIYRTFLKAKIAANQWDGTTTGAYAIWDATFDGITIIIIDNQDMTYDLGLVGGIVDSLTLALVTGGYLQLRPSGVQVNTYYIPGTAGPIFGWDLESSSIQGWDEGNWAKIINPT